MKKELILKQGILSAKTQHHLCYLQIILAAQLSQLEPQSNATRTSYKILKLTESAELTHKSNAIISSLETEYTHASKA